ncbi:hypothetical protein BBO_03300 [Beauveria brongniartii RCEF 3172]|uniref:Uncharacterized protein n=1 Tax=Beauveria brongniartii RCEF 3172 TaxID=1081107 RepID=A0A167GKC8_9HYPO|nr:hypothetical protein BBO_03300 [Beauveria brongniartii RCEF 3172]
MSKKTTVHVQERGEDLELLKQNNYNILVAKSVSAPGGSPRYNVVFKSASLAPNMAISWKSRYGLNWTTKIPNPGAAVQYGGKWHECNIGESYNLSNIGQWEKNNTNDANSNKDSLNVAKNNYDRGVHIIVGMYNEENDIWQAIFIASDQLFKNGSASFQPRDDIRVWFAEGMMAQTMIVAQSTSVQEHKMKENSDYYFRYLAHDGILG